MRLVGKIAFSILTILFFVEVAAKLWSEPSDLDREQKFLVRDETLGWKHRPLADGKFESSVRGFSARVTIDEQGLRRNGNELPDRPLEKVLILGDSTTSGMEVRNDQAYPAVLERLFWEHGMRARVYNAGVRGYGADQSLLQLRALVKRIHPDLVIYMAGPYGFQQLTMLKNWYRPWSKPAFALDGERLRLVNSPVQEMAEEDYAFIDYSRNQAVVTRRLTKPSGISRWLRHHSFLWAWGEGYYFGRFHLNRFLPPNDREWRVKTLAALLREMKGLAPRFAVTGFTMSDPKDVPDYDLFREIAQRNDVEFLDIRPFFREGVGYKIPMDGHWNSTGHARAAEALFELLEQKRIRRPLRAGRADAKRGVSLPGA